MDPIERLNNLADEWREQADKHRAEVLCAIDDGVAAAARGAVALTERRYGDADRALQTFEDNAAEAREALDMMFGALSEAAELDGAAAMLEETADLAAYHAKVL